MRLMIARTPCMVHHEWKVVCSQSSTAFGGIWFRRSLPRRAVKKADPQQTVQNLAGESAGVPNVGSFDARDQQRRTNPLAYRRRSWSRYGQRCAFSCTMARLARNRLSRRDHALAVQLDSIGGSVTMRRGL